ncbi:putative F-box protein PP2-B12 [Quercus suber]|nr:putative F-box protein PP2-B12 [Quercus suber]POF24282.1 f-box protein pp2-b10 [Quercus suber]
MKQSSGAEISALPEGCIANIVSFTTPKDACRACAVSPIFRAAAESNAVWERFLPSDYQAIIARSSSPDILNLPSKKQIYLRLSDNPILIDDNKKSFFLDKLSGKKCYLLAARDLSIVWGSTPEYWSWVSLPESRIPEVAELLDVCWFEICGKVSTSMLSLKTNSVAYLVFKLRSTAYGFDDPPFKASVGTIGGGEVYERSVCLDLEEPILDGQILLPEQPHISRPKRRKDGWLEIELGEFFNEGGQDDELQIRLMEVEVGRWKSGLVVEGIEIRPTMG